KLKYMNTISHNHKPATDAYTMLADAVIRPILFSTPMVQAILDGRKTQTRRTKGLEEINDFLKGDPHNYSFLEQKYFNGRLEQRINVANQFFVIHPKVNIGDIFWVRETFMDAPNFEDWGGEKYYYKASKSEQFLNEWKGNWKPSIFMPKEACRIFLKVTNMRVERLKDISEEDAI